MNRLFPSVMSASLSGHFQEEEAASSRIQGSWLVVARVAWAVIFSISLIHLVASIPTSFRLLERVCNTSGCLSPKNIQELHEMGISLEAGVTYVLSLEVLFALVGYFVGCLIFWKKSDERIGLFVSIMLISFSSVAFSSYVDSFSKVFPIWNALVTFLAFLGESCFFLFLYIFPDGRFIPRWTSSIGLLIVIVLGYFYIAIQLPTLPFLAKLLISTQIFWVLALFLFGLGIQLYRYWRISNRIQRQQTKLVVLGTSIAIMLYSAQAIVSSVVTPTPMIALLIDTTIGFLALMLIPISIGIAILRYQLWNISIIINRTLVYGLLTTLVVIIYVLVVGGLSSLFHPTNNLFISLIATGAIALTIQPLRYRLQQSINRLLYGERDNPYAVLSNLAKRLESTLAPEAVFSVIVDTIAHSLKLSYTAITSKQGEDFKVVASYGAPPEEQYKLPIVYQGEQIGELLLALHGPHEPFRSADLRLLEDLALQAGVAVHTAHLTKDLQRSRERLVTAREEARRRLRRNLHDGLGPTLAALNLQAGRIRKLISTDPTAADELVVEWRKELRTAIADIRRIAYDLRPPALDELGLIGAIREAAAPYNHPGSNLTVLIETPEQQLSLPAAVEVAAYRIAQSALLNVVQHAQAQTCHIYLFLTDALYLEVIDDGTGLPVPHRLGVGLLAMQERAAELGGTCIFENTSPKGMRVFARLPLLKD